MTPYCQSCGRSYTEGVDLRITFDARESEVICTICAGLIESGILRRDADADGEPRYRVWHFEWTPGDLRPAASDLREAYDLAVAAPPTVGVDSDPC